MDKYLSDAKKQVLTLTVSKEWFDMISDGRKTEEYFRTDTNSLTLYYDSQTSRSIDEQYYINKYRLKSKEA